MTARPGPYLAVFLQSISKCLPLSLGRVPPARLQGFRGLRALHTGAEGHVLAEGEVEVSAVRRWGHPGGGIWRENPEGDGIGLGVQTLTHRPRSEHPPAAVSLLCALAPPGFQFYPQGDALPCRPSQASKHPRKQKQKQTERSTQTLRYSTSGQERMDIYLPDIKSWTASLRSWKSNSGSSCRHGPWGRMKTGEEVELAPTAAKLSHCRSRAG